MQNISAAAVNFSTWISREPKLEGYGFSLGLVYCVWASLIVILYFLCKWYFGYKSSHRDKWWLSYLSSSITQF